MFDSRTTPQFWTQFARLPAEVQEQAKPSGPFARSEAIPSTPACSLRNSKEEERMYSARIGLGYRAVGTLKATRVVWFWIGKHSDFDRMFGD